MDSQERTHSCLRREVRRATYADRLIKGSGRALSRWGKSRARNPPRFFLALTPGPFHFSLGGVNPPEFFTFLGGGLGVSYLPHSAYRKVSRVHCPNLVLFIYSRCFSHPFSMGLTRAHLLRVAFLYTSSANPRDKLGSPNVEEKAIDKSRAAPPRINPSPLVLHRHPRPPPPPLGSHRDKMSRK